MRSWKFPNMFSNTSSNIWKSKEYLEATTQNAILTLHSEKGDLYGDPYFGTTLQHLLFSQNSVILKDVLIDQIYTQLALFLPQVTIDRNDIKIVRDLRKGLVIINFKGTSKIDYQLNTYSLTLFNEQA